LKTVSPHFGSFIQRGDFKGLGRSCWNGFLVSTLAMNYLHGK